MTLPVPATVSFDVYSALIDSRRGGGTALESLAASRRWPVDGTTLYDTWDALNKGLHRDTVAFLPFRTLARQAMTTAFERLAIEDDPTDVADRLLSSVDTWPHYPDVPDAVRETARLAPVAVVSNTDDLMLARTNLGYDFDRAVISEHGHCYKPHRAFYARAEQVLGTPLVHVAASARDVRGALEARLSVIRIERPGHRVDPDGPQPEHVIDDLRDLPGLLTGSGAAPGP